MGPGAVLRRWSRGLVLAVPAVLALPVLAAPPALAAASCDGRTATVVGSGAINGTAGNDVIVGSGGKDTINGRGGNDRICGLAGADTITDGPGDDHVLAGGGADTFLQGASANGADVLEGNAGADTVSYASRTAPVTVTLAASDPDGGTAEGDVVYSTERVTGGSSTDHLSGTQGADVLRGGAGNDVLDALGGADVLQGDAGDDHENGGLGQDAFDQGTAADGTDTLDGGGFDPGAVDLVDYSGRTGDVTLFGAVGSGEVGEGDTITGEIEDFRLGGGNDTAFGNSLANAIDGGPGNDDLQGRSGNDTLTGGPGDDVLTGGLGFDALSTGDGADSVVIDFTTASNQEAVSDFAAGTDVVACDMSAMAVGNGDTVVTSTVSAGIWSASAELFIDTSDLSSATSASAVGAELSSASAAIPVGARKILVADDGTSSGVWYFVSDGDADVEGSELTLLAGLAATPTTGATDYAFIP